MNDSIIRTFRAASLPEALRLIHQELGPDATVHSTVRKPSGIFGRLVGQNRFEVTASSPCRPMPQPAQDADPEPISLTMPPDTDDDWYRTAAIHYRDRFRQYAVDDMTNSNFEQAIEETATPPLGNLADILVQLYHDLVRAEVEPCFARQLVAQLDAEFALRTHLEARELLPSLRRNLCSAIETISSPSLPRYTRTIALVGPSGSGKTTTLAKLAAHWRLQDKLRIGLISIDTYRMSATEQLRNFARLLDTPVEIVRTPREMYFAIDKLRDVDVILIDTDGCSPHDHSRLQELHGILQEANPDEVHLVASCTDHPRLLSRTIESFQAIPVTALILTKLDEAGSWGHLISVLCGGAIPLSYTTNGRQISSDFHVATSAEFVDHLLNQCFTSVPSVTPATASLSAACRVDDVLNQFGSNSPQLHERTSQIEISPSKLNLLLNRNESTDDNGGGVAAQPQVNVR